MKERSIFIPHNVLKSWFEPWCLSEEAALVMSQIDLYFYNESEEGTNLRCVAKSVRKLNGFVNWLVEEIIDKVDIDPEERYYLDRYLLN